MYRQCLYQTSFHSVVLFNTIHAMLNKISESESESFMVTIIQCSEILQLVVVQSMEVQHSVVKYHIL